MLFVPEAPYGTAAFENSGLAPGYWLNFKLATLLAGSRPVVLLYLDYDRLRGQPSVLSLDVRDVVDEPSDELYRGNTRRRPSGIVSP